MGKFQISSVILQFLFLVGQCRHMEITDGVYSFTMDGSIISMWVITGDGVVVVESFNSAFSTQMLQEIREVTQDPIKYLIQSHDHLDHSSGGQVFRDEGAQIIAHSEAVTSMRVNGWDDTAIPDLEWSGDSLDMEVGGVTIKLHYFGINHGNGMTVVNFVDYGMLYLADLVVPNRIMYIIVPDFNIGEWIRSIEEILALSWDTAVCSHNEMPDPLVPATYLDAVLQLQFIRDLQQACMDEMAKGTPFFEIANVVRLPDYSSWVLYDDFLAMNAWRILLDMGMGPYPWRDIGQARKLDGETRDVSNMVLH